MLRRKVSRRAILADLTLSVLGIGILQACAPAAAPSATPQAAATTAPTGPATSPTAAPTVAAATSGAPTATTASTSAATTAATATSAPAATAPAGAAAAEIRISHWWGDTFKKSMLVQAAKDLPSLTIKEEASPFDQYHTKLLTQLAGGVAPDAFLQDSYFNGEFFPSGAELALDDYLKSSSDLDPKKWGIPLEKETAFKGKIYGLPQFYDEQVVLSFNTEIVDKAGIKLPVPGSSDFDSWNWDKMVETLVALTKRTSDGKVEQWGLGQNFTKFGFGHEQIIYQNGGKLFNTPDYYGETEILLTSPEVVQAMQDMADLSLKHKVTPSATEMQAIQGGPFKAKKAAASIYTGLAAISKDFPFPFTTIAMPYRQGPARLVGGNHWALNPKSKALDGAWQWIKFSTSNVEALDAAGWPTWHSMPDYDPNHFVGTLKPGDMRQMYEAWLTRQWKFEQPRWLGQKAPAQVQQIIGSENDAVYQGKKSMADAMASAKAQIDPLLNK